MREESDKRIAVVTGSTAGIGLSVAERLAGQGYHVVISSRKQEHVDDAVGQIRRAHGHDAASGLCCHVASEVDREALLQHANAHGLRRIDALIVNAAVSAAFGPIVDTTEAQWDKIFDVNLKAAFLLVKAFAPWLRRGSSIVFVSSIAAYNALPGVGAYSVSKTALVGLCKVLAVEFGARGVRVNAVAPGIIRTRFSQRLWQGDDSLAASAVSGMGTASKLFFIPLRRVGEPRDVSGVIAFLVSEDAAYITGETVVMAGGAMSKL